MDNDLIFSHRCYISVLEEGVSTYLDDSIYFFTPISRNSGDKYACILNTIICITFDLKYKTRRYPNSAIAPLVQNQVHRLLFLYVYP